MKVQITIDTQEKVQAALEMAVAKKLYASAVLTGDSVSLEIAEENINKCRKILGIPAKVIA